MVKDPSGDQSKTSFTPDTAFDAVASPRRRVEGSYAAIAVIAGQGVLAFGDPFGIRPLILGRRQAGLVGDEWIVAIESLVLEASGYDIVRDVEPGEEANWTKLPIQTSRTPR